MYRSVGMDRGAWLLSQCLPVVPLIVIRGGIPDIAELSLKWAHIGYEHNSLRG